MIVVVDYRMGNIGSVLNMLKKIGAPSIFSSDRQDIEKADKLILPGVGSFDKAMQNIGQSGLGDILTERILKEKIPVLGICLGMQIMAGKSGEGELPGLGWVDAEVVRFRPPDNDQRLRVPHMGWNIVSAVKESRLFPATSQRPRFYFVHSYHVVCSDQADVTATCRHGCEFVCAFEKDNIYGVQFHPEKSHIFGLDLLKRFVEI